jgi:hypothetical protein
MKLRSQLDILWTCWSIITLHLEVLIFWWGFPFQLPEDGMSLDSQVSHIHKEHTLYPQPVHYDKLRSAPRCNHDIKFFHTWTINHHSYDSWMQHHTRTCYLTRSSLAMELSDHQNGGRYFSETRVIEKLSPTPVMFLSASQSAWFHRKLLPVQMHSTGSGHNVQEPRVEKCRLFLYKVLILNAFFLDIHTLQMRIYSFM